MMNGLIIIVNFDQEKEIASFLKKLSRANPGLDAVVVDDGSSDQSPEIAEEHGYVVLRHYRNMGVGAAIRTGINHARGNGHFDYVVIMSSNGKMDPDDLSIVIGPIIRNEADYVQGSRFLRGGHALGLSTFRRTAIP